MAYRFFCFMVASSLVISACGVFSPPEERVVITVGSTSVTANELKRDIKRLTSGMGITDQEVKDVISPLVNKVIDDYLIMEYGRKFGITIPDDELELAIRDIKKDYQERVFQEMLLQRYIDFEEWKEGLRQQLFIRKIVKKVSEGITPITFDEIRSYFDSHKEEFRRSETVKFRQIVTKTRKDAERMLERLKKGEDLGELAKKYSAAPEAEKGGEVGWVSTNELEESMEKVIFSLPIGKVSPVVETPYGYHIFEVLSKRPEGYKSLPEAMAEIESKLFHQKEGLFYNKWLKELRQYFPVEVDQEVLRTMEFG